MRPLRRVSISYTLSGLHLVHGRAASSGHSTSLPFCLRFNDIVTDGAARLDTSCLAQAWLGGIRPRWMTRHFLFAPQMQCSLALIARTSRVHILSVRKTKQFHSGDQQFKPQQYISRELNGFHWEDLEAVPNAPPSQSEKALPTIAPTADASVQAHHQQRFHPS